MNFLRNSTVYDVKKQQTLGLSTFGKIAVGLQIPQS